METVVLRREELYADVWKTPMSKVAASHGISGVALGKICKKLAIPVPPRGYWARLNAGKKARIPPLPQVKAGAPTEHRLNRPQGLLRLPRQVDLGPRIVVQDVLSDPHRLIQMSLAALRHAAKTMSRATLSRRCVDVFVSESCLDRALRIMDALLKALEERGFVVEITKPEQPPQGRGQSSRSTTRVLVDGEWIGFRLEEHRQLVIETVSSGVHRYRTVKESRASGRFTLRIANDAWPSILGRSWSDGQKRRVENCLNEFTAALVAVSAAMKVERSERERRNREAEEAWRRRQEVEKRNEIERLLRQDLMVRAGAWNEAHRLQAFVDTVEASLPPAEGHQGDRTILRKQWIAWARHHARRMAADAIEGIPKLQASPSELVANPAWRIPGPAVTADEVAAYLLLVRGSDLNTKGS